jgi:tol-pal system protein YbgF
VNVPESLCIGAAGLALLLTGCNGNQEAMQRRIDDLQSQVQELQKNTGRQNVRVGDLEDRVSLIDDKVATNRLALERRGVVRELPMVRVAPGPGGGMVVRGDTYTSSPPEYDPYVRPDAGVRARIAVPTPRAEAPLYEERPVAVAPRAPDPEPAGERVVINEDTYREFLEEEGGVDDAPAPRAVRKRSPRVGVPSEPSRVTGQGPRAKAPVTDERLPVVAAAGTAGPPSAKIDNPRDLYKRGLASYRAGKYAEARKDFDQYLRMGPSADYLDNAYYWLGECAYGMGRHKEALTYFGKVIKETPDGNKVPDSMLKAALAYVRIGQKGEARSTLYNLLETYPNTNAARLAAQKLKELE